MICKCIPSMLTRSSTMVHRFAEARNVWLHNQSPLCMYVIAHEIMANYSLASRRASTYLCIQHLLSVQSLKFSQPYLLLDKFFNSIVCVFFLNRDIWA